MFLGLVRGYDALPIGEIMMVTGAAQLAMAPVATMLERRADARLLIAAGYALLAIGWLGNGFMTCRDRFLGAVLAADWRAGRQSCCACCRRTALALGSFEPARRPERERPVQPDAQSRRGDRAGDDRHGDRTARARPMSPRLVSRLQAGDAAAARLVGLPTERFTGVAIGPVDSATRDLVAPLVERAGLVAAFNDAWLWIGGAMLLSLLLLPLLRAAPARD